MIKRILIVDDSAFMRKILTDHISAVPKIEVIGTARNGEDALEKIAKFEPDAITLDVEMPGMDGLETVKEIRKKSDLPVFMVSSLQGSDITLQALESGATDFIRKPKNIFEKKQEFQQEIADRLAILFDKKEKKIQTFSMLDQASVIQKETRAIVIGASTGGPRALLQLVQALPEDLSIPIFIVQHMPEGFTTSFANRLNDHARVPVKEAEHGEEIQPGTVYLAPGNFHMTIFANRILLHQQPKIHGMRPAVDFLFESAAEYYGKDVLAVILTGMGKDGTDGMKHIKHAGGHTIAQSQASCVVYGMPGSAMKAGVVDVCVALEQISDIINEILKVKR